MNWTLLELFGGFSIYSPSNSASFRSDEFKQRFSYFEYE